MNETAQLAKFTAEMEFDKLPPQAVRMAKQCLLDWLGVALRGAHEEPARILRETALKMCGTGGSTVFDGGSRRVDPVSAALVNGAASHTLDFDDLHNPSIIHLATVVIPAAVAVAEACHKSGKALLTAICAGYEAGARAGEAIIPESYFYWHTTAQQVFSAVPRRQLPFWGLMHSRQICASAVPERRLQACGNF